MRRARLRIILTVVFAIAATLPIILPALFEPLGGRGSRLSSSKDIQLGLALAASAAVAGAMSANFVWSRYLRVDVETWGFWPGALTAIVSYPLLYLVLLIPKATLPALSANSSLPRPPRNSYELFMAAIGNALSDAVTAMMMSVIFFPIGAGVLFVGGIAGMFFVAVLDHERARARFRAKADDPKRDPRTASP